MGGKEVKTVIKALKTRSVRSETGLDKESQGERRTKEATEQGYEENLKRSHTSLGLACCHGNSNQAGRAADSYRLPLHVVPRRYWRAELSPWMFSSSS